jgi:signal transduction histidine kinase
MSEQLGWHEELGRRIEELHGHEARRALELLFQEIQQRAEVPLDSDSLTLSSSEAVGRSYANWAGSLPQAVRIVLQSGRVLRECWERSGTLSDSTDRRLTILIAEAAADVAGWIEKSQSQRRDAWLSYLTHELKNPLNTILNALWLLREKGREPSQAARFLEMAERAVRRIEGRIRDVRTLDEHLTALPPGWEARFFGR